MAQFSKFSGRDKRRSLVDKRNKRSSYSRLSDKGDSGRALTLRDMVMGDFRVTAPEIYTKDPYNKRKKQKVSVSFQGNSISANKAGDKVYFVLKEFIGKPILALGTPVQQISIPEYGNWAENPETARTSHLDPVISFIRDLGYRPLAEEFIFDKSGFGQYMFNNYPDRRKLRIAIEKGLFPMSRYVEAVRIGKKSILINELAPLLRSRFKFPDSIEIGDNGFVYDNGNAIQIGFSNLSEHPMLRKRG